MGALALLRTFTTYEDAGPFAADEDLVFGADIDDEDYNGTGLRVHLRTAGLLAQALARHGVADSIAHAQQAASCVMDLLSATSLGERGRIELARRDLEESIGNITDML